MEERRDPGSLNNPENQIGRCFSKSKEVFNGEF
jgi:hypothetical protein